MEFGRLLEDELMHVDLSLAPEPAFNRLVLKGRPVKKPKVYIGCAKWGRTEWVGKLYPPSTKERDFLQHYVQHYNSIELNAMHYKMHGAEIINKWAEKANGIDFKFCPKMYKGVSHFGSLANKQLLTTDFIKAVKAFKEHLGPVFIQLSDRFAPKRKQELFDYLATLPEGIQFFVEVRHIDWFTKPDVTNEYFETLKALNIGAVITDTSGRRDCAHMHITVPTAFVRYVGNSLHPTDYKRMDEWVTRIKFWLSKGLKELYFFMHMHNEALSPELTVYLVDQLNVACNLSLIKPMMINN